MSKSFKLRSGNKPPFKQVGSYWDEVKNRGENYLDKRSKNQMGMTTKTKFTDQLKQQIDTLTGDLPRVVDFTNMTREDWERHQQMDKASRYGLKHTMGWYDKNRKVTDPDKPLSRQNPYKDNPTIRVKPVPYRHDHAKGIRRHEYKHFEQDTVDKNLMQRRKAEDCLLYTT